MVIGCVAAYSEAERIGEALASLRPLVDQIVVVDGARKSYPLQPGQSAASEDGTLRIARSYGATIIENGGAPWPHEIAQRSEYFIGSEGDWYLVLDADERIAGELPDLHSATDAYLVRITDDAGKSIWRGRLFKHLGWMTYANTHYAIYRDGQLMHPLVRCNSLAIAHAVRSKSDARRAEQRNTNTMERAYLRKGRPPERILRGYTMSEIAFLYIGNGAWVPGLPARDLTEADAVEYGDLLAVHMQTASPIYEAVASARKPAPVVAETEEALDDVGDADDADTSIDEASEDNTGKGRKSRKRSA